MEGPPIAGLAILLALAFAYMLPTVVAVLTKNGQTIPVFIINLFLGWTLLGWVVALALAFWKKTT